MSKYKFSLAPQIKSYIEWQLSHYHEDKRQLEQIKTDMIPSPVQSLSFTGGCVSSGENRAAENVAMRIITNPYVQQLERSCAAIGKVYSRLTEIDRTLVDLVYWKQTYTVEGAGMKLHMARRTAYRHINDILSATALEMGYINI